METNTSTFQIYRSNEAAINIHASLAGWVVKIRRKWGGNNLANETRKKQVDVDNVW